MAVYQIPPLERVSLLAERIRLLAGVLSFKVQREDHESEALCAVIAEAAKEAEAILDGQNVGPKRRAARHDT